MRWAPCVLSMRDNKYKYFILIICGLFNDAISISEYMASNDRMISEQSISKRVEVSDRGIV
jgi:hypothetical protein